MGAPRQRADVQNFGVRSKRRIVIAPIPSPCFAHSRSSLSDLRLDQKKGRLACGAASLSLCGAITPLRARALLPFEHKNVVDLLSLSIRSLGFERQGVAVLGHVSHDRLNYFAALLQDGLSVVRIDALH